MTDELGGMEYRKPCDKAFVMMRGALGCGYEKMCYVGDNVKKGFTAPEKLGMRAVWFKNKESIYRMV